MLKKALIVSVAVLMLLSFSLKVDAQLCVPSSTYDALSWTWQYYGPCSTTYNCLSYAIGVTNTWTWPWGSVNPTDSQVNSYMNTKGYATSGSTAKIVSYWKNSRITHFSKIIGSSTCLAKCGQLNILKHFSWNPYNSTGSYGTQKRVYYKKNVSAYISGPRKGTNQGTYTWCANASGGQAPYTYQWQHSYGSHGYSNCGTSRCRNVSLPYDYDLRMKVTVTDSNGKTATAQIFVINMSGFKPDRNRRQSMDSLKNHIAELKFNLKTDSLSPNPYDYIENAAFKKIVAMGPEALERIRREILVSDGDGLIDYLLAIAAEKIAIVDLKKQSDKWDTAEGWVFSWDKFVKDLPSRVDGIINSESSEDEKNRKLEALGLTALPILEDRIKEGNSSLTVAFNNLINKIDFSSSEARQRKAGSQDEVVNTFRKLIKLRKK